MTEAGGRPGPDSSFQPSEGTNPADTFASDFQPPGLLLKPLSLRGFVTTAPGKESNTLPRLCFLRALAG